MSLDKSIEHGKDHRKGYRKSKAFDFTCRNHGACGYCRDNRLIQSRRESERLKMDESEPSSNS